MRKPMRITVKTMYPTMISAGDGIFTDLQSFNVPWAELNIATVLNYGYYQQSARKNVSPFVFDVGNVDYDLITAPYEPQALTTEERNIIASTIYRIFYKKWDRLWDTYTIQYDPLFNYNIVEDETIDEDGTSTTNNTGTQSVVTDTDKINTGTDTHNISRNEIDGGTDNVTKSGTVQNTGTDTTVTDTDTTNTGTVQGTGTEDILDGIFGFNSSTSVGSDTRDRDTTSNRTDNLAGTLDTTETNTQNLTETTNITDARTRNLTHTATNSDTETKNLTETVDTTNTRTDNLRSATVNANDSVRHLTKKGNIGFNTPQEMLAADLELWQWNFFKTVFDDIDSILTMSVY